MGDKVIAYPSALGAMIAGARPIHGRIVERAGYVRIDCGRKVATTTGSARYLPWQAGWCKATDAASIQLARIGEYWEAFADDAETLARLVGLTLTHTGDGTALCGFPVIRADEYFEKIRSLGVEINTDAA